MFRNIVSKNALRAARRPAAAARPVPRFVFAQPRIPQALFATSTHNGISRDDIKARIFDILKTFDKVDSTKLSESASFTGDLGLDSLDAVEVVMAVEEEFYIDIPDAEADEIQTVQQAIDYVAKTPDAE